MVPHFRRAGPTRSTPTVLWNDGSRYRPRTRMVAAPALGERPRPPCSTDQVGTMYPPAATRFQMSAGSTLLRAANMASMSSRSTASTHAEGSCLRMNRSAAATIASRSSTPSAWASVSVIATSPPASLRTHEGPRCYRDARGEREAVPNQPALLHALGPLVLHGLPALTPQ